jgi:hypothetical protein
MHEEYVGQVAFDRKISLRRKEELFACMLKGVLAEGEHDGENVIINAAPGLSQNLTPRIIKIYTVVAWYV